MDDSVFSEKEKEEMERIILKYPNVLAKHADDMGKTSLAYHYTKLTTDVPVKANYYKAPPPKVRE